MGSIKGCGWGVCKGVWGEALFFILVNKKGWGFGFLSKNGQPKVK